MFFFATSRRATEWEAGELTNKVKVKEYGGGIGDHYFIDHYLFKYQGDLVLVDLHDFDDEDGLYDQLNNIHDNFVKNGYISNYQEITEIIKPISGDYYFVFVFIDDCPCYRDSYNEDLEGNSIQFHIKLYEKKGSKINEIQNYKDEVIGTGINAEYASFSAFDRIIFKTNKALINWIIKEKKTEKRETLS